MGLRQSQLNDILKANATASSDSIDSAMKAKRDREAQKAQQDAALAQLIKGKELDQSGKQEMLSRQIQEAERMRGQYGADIPVNIEGVSIGAKDPMAGLKALLARRELEQPKRTEGQIAADKAFGQEYADFVAGGGNEAAKKNLGLLEGVQKQLEAKGNQAPNWLERGVQFLPDAARAALTPDIKAQEDQVRTAVQASLKQTLGAQFAQKEGEELMKRSYDPRLSPQQNLAKLKPEIEAIKAQLSRKMQSAQQFERTGSLVGLGAASQAPQAQGGMLSPEQQRRLQELRAKKAAGAF